jgi:hypothetical protein
VARGDWVVADRDGIVVIPALIAEDVIAEAEEKAATENEIRAAVRAGTAPLDAYERYGTSSARRPAGREFDRPCRRCVRLSAIPDGSGRAEVVEVRRRDHDVSREAVRIRADDVGTHPTVQERSGQEERGEPAADGTVGAGARLIDQIGAVEEAAGGDRELVLGVPDHDLGRDEVGSAQGDGAGDRVDRDGLRGFLPTKEKEEG